MAQTIRDVLIRIGIEQRPTTLQIPGIETATKQQKEYEKAQKDAVAAQQRAAEEGRKSSEQLAQVNFNAGQKILGSFNQAGEGAFQLARGIAFLSGRGEDDLRQLINAVATVQGYFDAFRGTVTTVRTLAEVIQTLKAAQQAQAAAATTAAAAQTAANTAAAGGTTVITSLLSLLGPYGRAIAVVGTAAASTAIALRLFGDESQAAEKKFREQRVEGLQSLQEEIRRQHESRRVYTESVNARLRDAFRLRDALRQAGDTTVESRLAERTRLAGQTSAAILGDPGAHITELERVAELDRQRVDSARKVQDAAKAQMEFYAGQLRNAQAIVDLERKRVQSAQELIGRLTDAERIELRTLGQRAGRGQITREEVQRAEQLGGQLVQPFASRFFRERGRGQVDETLAGFGLPQFEGRGSRLDEATRRLGEQIQQSAGGAADALRDFVRGFAQQQEAQRDQIQALKNLSVEQRRLTSETGRVTKLLKELAEDAANTTEEQKRIDIQRREG